MSFFDTNLPSHPDFQSKARKLNPGFGAFLEETSIYFEGDKMTALLKVRVLFPIPEKSTDFLSAPEIIENQKAADPICDPSFPQRELDAQR